MSDSKNPKSQLWVVHRIMISMSIVFGMIFTGFSVHRQQYGVAGLTAVMSVALALYLRWFLKKPKP